MELNTNFLAAQRLASPALLLGLLVLLIALGAGPVLADGMFISPRYTFMYETAQQAVLEWDGDSHQERLTILPSFYGDAHSFGWILPVPGLPEVTAAQSNLFRELDTVTAPLYRSRDGDWGCLNDEHFSPDSGGTNADVEIITEELVGYYRTLVLHADDSAALEDSLGAWGFLHEENQADVTDILQHYVDKDWYFVAMQVDSTALEGYWNYYQKQDMVDPWYYPYWGLEPVTLDFASDVPVYPMRISSYSAYSNTRVNLYTVADRRLTFTGALTHYANRFDPGEVAALREYTHLPALLQQGEYLTKLQRTYDPVDMDMDIVLETAPDQSEYRGIYYSGFPLTSLLLLGSPVAWLGWRTRKNWLK